MSGEFAAPKGIPDYFPPASADFLAVRNALTGAAHRAGYGHIELPIFEDTALFARGVGESTDVVSKEMYTFADRGGRTVTLRPEGTAGVMRAVIQHGLDRGQLPVKVCYAGPFFRYERPQAGRYRQLQQVGVEAIGVDDPARLLRPLLEAALENALQRGDRALTGPVARGDVGTIAAHLAALRDQPEDIGRAYRSLASATAARTAARHAMPAESVQPMLDLLTAKED